VPFHETSYLLGYRLTAQIVFLSYSSPPPPPEDDEDEDLAGSSAHVLLFTRFAGKM
jgi:hypothetical protein